MNALFGSTSNTNNNNGNSSNSNVEKKKPIKKESEKRKQFWAAGTGFGHGTGSSEVWDAKKAHAAQKAQDVEIQKLLNDLSQSLRNEMGYRNSIVKKYFDTILLK